MGIHAASEGGSAAPGPGVDSAIAQFPRSDTRVPRGFKLEQINVARPTHEPMALPE
jgi:hypothetical protein